MLILQQETKLYIYKARDYIFWLEGEPWQDARDVKWSPSAHWTDAPICQGLIGRARWAVSVCACVHVSCSFFLISKLLQLEVTGRAMV